LHRNGIAFSNDLKNNSDPAKISTYISLKGIYRVDQESFDLSEVIIRGAILAFKNRFK
tara:strand:- start:318 stop:491 length:174 start_codon:yes stop_codon:yes gene_type:complete